MTLLEGPYDNIPSKQKTRVQALIPEELYRKLFYRQFPNRGVQDKILSRVIFYLDEYLTKHDLCKTTDLDNEVTLNNILNNIEFPCPKKIKSTPAS